MTITQNPASKLLVGFVVASMLFTLSFAPVKAATAEELQAQIDMLMKQIAALKGGTTGGSMTSGAAVCPYTWNVDLRTGSAGADVKALQQFLNSDAETRVAASGVGSAGMETMTFGPMTAAAVSKFQTKYRADILTPNGLVAPTGTFGPSSRAKANMLCSTASPVDDGDDTDTDTDTDTTDLSGEASLDTFEVADGEEADDVEEGSEDVIVGEFTVEFSDGDAMITRLDIALDGTANTVNTEDDPWDVFEDVSLWVDGEEVARMDANDKDDYLDEDDGSLRFSGLDIVGMEDEELVIEVAATIVGSVDDAGSATLADWDLTAEAIRFIDADDVTTTDNSTGDLGGAATAEFTIDTVGAGDDLDLETSSEDPDESTIALDTDNNVEETIFAFELSAEDSDRDIDLNEVVVHVVISGGATNVDDLVNDFRLEIDGTSYDAESYTGTGVGADITFDINGDETIAKDEVVTATLFADFEDMEAADEGSTITASTSPSDIDAEGADDVTVDGSTITGETHTLRTEGLDVTFVSDSTTKTFTADETGEKDKVKYTVVFKVAAIGDSMYLDRTVTRDDTTAGGSAGDGFMWATTTDSTTGTTSVSATVSASDTDSDDTATQFYIAEGEERTFTMNVTLEAGIDGVAAVKVTAINWDTDGPTDATPDNFHTTGLDDFKTDLEDLFTE